MLLLGGFNAGSRSLAPVSDACAGFKVAPDIVFFCCAAKQLKQQLETLLAPKK